MELAGRVIAIPGAGGSLGTVVVERFAAAGATLALAGRDASKLESLGAGADVEAVDLLDLAAARAWADGIAERHGRVDAVAHLVGGWRGGKAIEEAPLEDWDWLEEVVVRTTQTVTQAFAPHLIASRGHFLIVSAGQAQAPTHTNAAYAAAKAAAETWTLALAHRFKGTGATANVVVVGAIVTPAMRAEKPDGDFSTFTPAEQISDAIAYVCSGSAASMNGERLVLRGAA